LTGAPDLTVLYQDSHLLAVFKPARMPVQADPSGDPALLDIAKQWLKVTLGRPGNVYLGLVHRLDRPVAGVVLFARTSKAAARLSKQFRERTPEKIYRAVVEGVPEAERGDLANYIRKEKSLKATVFTRETPGAKEARLHYTTLFHRPSHRRRQEIPRPVEPSRPRGGSLRPQPDDQTPCQQKGIAFRVAAARGLAVRLALAPSRLMGGRTFRPGHPYRFHALEAVPAGGVAPSFTSFVIRSGASSTALRPDQGGYWRVRALRLGKTAAIP
jgi:hypothetical protein